MGNPTFFIDDSAVVSRTVEVPDANWGDGMNASASKAGGIGINMNEGAVSGDPSQFTLLDQNGAARTPQTASQLGNTGFVNREGGGTPWPSSGGAPGVEGDSIREGTPNPGGDGSVTGVGNSHLADLAIGWVPVNP